MKLFASKDKKYEIVKVTDRAGNVYEIPVGPDGYVPQEAMKARFQSRYPDIFSKGALRDLSRSSKKIYPAKMTPEEALQWWKATNKSDVEGIDAPSGTSNYVPPVRKRAEKKKAQKKSATASKPTIAKAPSKPAYYPRTMRPEERTIQNYKDDLHQELVRYMADDYVTVWGVDELKSKYNMTDDDFAFQYVPIGPYTYVRKDRRAEFESYLKMNQEAVEHTRADMKYKSDAEDRERRARVEERRKSAKMVTPTATQVQYSSVSEETARRANDVNSFRNYEEGSATRDYKEVVDEVVRLGVAQKAKVDPMYWPEIDRTIQSFSKRYAEWLNRKNSVDASVPSVLIAGPSGISSRKKEKQNNARDALWREYNDLMKIEDRIKSIGKGGITMDDSNAVAKIEDKLVKLQDAHESKVRINKAVRAGENSKAFSMLNDREKAEAKIRIDRDAPIPGWELSNENAEIRRLKGRLTDIEREQSKRQSGVQTGYPTMDGLEVVENAGENRIQLIFDDKPSDEARGVLKHNGFRWSPKNSAWQRELNDNGRRAAKRAIEELISAGGWE